MSSSQLLNGTSSAPSSSSTSSSSSSSSSANVSSSSASMSGLRLAHPSQMPIIYLIRHGESYFNARDRYFKGYKQMQQMNPNEIGPGQDARLVDSDLTETGQQQALDASKQVSQLPLDGIICSPLTRAMHTCMRISRPHMFTGDKAPKPPVPVFVCPLHVEIMTSSCDIGTPTSLLKKIYAPYAPMNFDACKRERWWYGADKGLNIPEVDLRLEFNPDGSIKGKPVLCRVVQEQKPHVDLRIRELINFILSRPEKIILIVGHFSFFYRMTGEKFKNCIAAGTHIETSNSVSKSIEEIQPQKECVRAMNEEEEGIGNRQCEDKIDNGIRDCVTIQLEDGRKLVCTDDHHILTQHRGWITAGQLNSSDRIICSIQTPLESTVEMTEELGKIDWQRKLCSSGVELTDKRTVSAFARLSARWLLKSKTEHDRSAFQFSHQLDGQTVADDLANLYSYEPIVRFSASSYSVGFPPKLSEDVEGFGFSDQSLRSALPPNFYSAPLLFQREFISVLFSVLATPPALLSNGFSSVRLPVGSDLSTGVVSDIQHVLQQRLQVKNCDVNVFSLELKDSSVDSFVQHVGFRYSVQKQQQATIAAVYQRSKQFIGKDIDAKQFVNRIGARKVFSSSSCSSSTLLSSFGLAFVSRVAAGLRHVYDLSVRGDHNFSANGIIVHNCEIKQMNWNDVIQRWQIPYTAREQMLKLASANNLPLTPSNSTPTSASNGNSSANNSNNNPGPNTPNALVKSSSNSQSSGASSGSSSGPASALNSYSNKSKDARNDSSSSSSTSSCTSCQSLPNIISKVDESGRYLPYCGYTLISMLHSRERWQFIETFFSNSKVLKNYYSVLPASSYHMTVLDLFSQGQPHHHICKEHFKQRIQHNHGSAIQQSIQWLQSNAKQSFTPELVTMYRRGCIGIELKLSSDDSQYAHQIRSSLSKLFNLTLSSYTFHMTFAYNYRAIWGRDLPLLDREIEQLVTLIKNHMASGIKVQFEAPRLCYFEDMTVFQNL